MEQQNNSRFLGVSYLILSILLLLCLVPMPYGYYQLVRFIAAFSFCIYAWHHNSQKQTNGIIIFGGLALLFQPFFKIALGRTTWNIVDVIVAGYFVWLWYKGKKKQ